MPQGVFWPILVQIGQYLDIEKSGELKCNGQTYRQTDRQALRLSGLCSFGALLCSFGEILRFFRAVMCSFGALFLVRVAHQRTRTKEQKRHKRNTKCVLLVRFSRMGKKTCVLLVRRTKWTHIVSHIPSPAQRLGTQTIVSHISIARAAVRNTKNELRHTARLGFLSDLNWFINLKILCTVCVIFKIWGGWSGGARCPIKWGGGAPPK